MADNLADIIARLETANEADPELDVVIWLAFTPGATRRDLVISATDKRPGWTIDETRDATGRLITAPPVTSSLDAAVALAARVLPGWSYEVRASGTGDKGQATVWNPLRAVGEIEFRVTGMPSPALALCLALVRAVAAKKDK